MSGVGKIQIMYNVINCIVQQKDETMQKQNKIGEIIEKKEKIMAPIIECWDEHRFWVRHSGSE